VAIVAAAPLLACACTSSAIASALTSGTSPLSTTTGASGSMCAVAALTAPPVPSACGCTANITPSGSTPSRARAGESTTTTRPGAADTAWSAARTGHNTIGMPHSSCNTLGVPERMRVPWPAARIRTVGTVIAMTLNALPRGNPSGA